MVARTPFQQARRGTILIVDDQEQNRKVVSTVLTMHHYDVISAYSGKDAIGHMERRVPDLILLDVLMPVMDGLEVCRQIKGDPRWAEVPVIFLSAADDKSLIVEALEAGGVDYVTKPFNRSELLTRVQTHLALKQARDQLRRLAEDKDELLGILAHDLKNHLAGMKLSAGLLQNRKDTFPPKSATLIDNIVQSTDRMLTFVREFLANQSAERLTLDLDHVDLCMLLRQVVVGHREMAEVKNMTLELDLPPEPILAHGDKDALTQALDNLVSNAIKFSPPGKRVVLRASDAPGQWVQCQIQDEGPGFTEGDFRHVFRRYTRLSARPTGGEPSTGLGLSIVKRLVEEMNGLVVVENIQPSGACFTIKLPQVEHMVLSGHS